MTHTNTYRALTGAILTIGISLVLGSETLLLDAHLTGGGSAIELLPPRVYTQEVQLHSAAQSEYLPTAAAATLETTLIVGMLTVLLAFVLHGLAVLRNRKLEQEERKWSHIAKEWFDRCMDMTPMARR